MKRFWILALAILMVMRVAFVLPANARQPAISSTKVVAEIPLNQLHQALTSNAVLDHATNDMTIDRAEISRYLQQGQRLYEAERFVEAIDLWQQAAVLAQQYRYPIYEALSYNNLSIAYQALGRWTAAREAIQRATTLNQSLPDPFLKAEILRTQGSLEFYTETLEAALASWRRSTALYRSIQDIPHQVLSQLNQAQALQTLKQYQQAQTVLTQAYQAIATLPDSPLKQKHLWLLGMTWHRGGNLRQAEAILMEGFAIAASSAKPPFQQEDRFAEFDPAEFDPAKFDPAKFDPAKFDPAEFDPTEFDPAEILIELGDIAETTGNTTTALKFYVDAQARATQPRSKITAALHYLKLLTQRQDWQAALRLVPDIQDLLTEQPASRWSLYASIDFAKEKIHLWRSQSSLNPSLNNSNTNSNLNSLPNPPNILTGLTQAVQKADALDDRQSSSYALGGLGFWYEQQEQWTDAFKLTEQALILARSIEAERLISDWQWQRGRILKAQGKREWAIAAYEQAVNRVTASRPILVANQPHAPFSPVAEREPLYRQYAEVLLQNIAQLPELIQQYRLQRARAAIETLQQERLQTFLSEFDQTTSKTSIETLDSHAAVIYPILLEQRLEVIVSLPGKPLQHYGTDLEVDAMTKLVNTIRQSLNPAFPAAEGLPAARQLYDWLIRPIAPALQQNNITTLVFIPDDQLREIPLSILHDGDRYLIETYNVALNLSLRIAPGQPLINLPFHLLLGGLTEARQGFSALPAVAEEIENIAQQIKATEIEGKVLLNQDFTNVNLQAQIQSDTYSVIHLATHGQFSSKAEDSFILTWEERITVQELSEWLHQTSDRIVNYTTDQTTDWRAKHTTDQAVKRAISPLSFTRSSQIPSQSRLSQFSGNNRLSLELLVLSACQTAKGDDRATMGLAGVALRSGAKSTVATLWSVQDQSTAALMTAFYRFLQTPGNTRASALRQAQLSLMQEKRYQHPYYWAGFVLIGNWL